jgi:hypothetical protein
MSPPNITVTREQAFRVLGAVVVVSLGWGAVEARVSRVEDQQRDQRLTVQEIKADIKEVRQDVKELLRSRRSEPR